MPTTTRFYVTPRVGTGTTEPYRPQSFIGTDGLSWIAGKLTCQDYGGEPSYFVTAVMTDAEHATALTLPGVTAVVPEPTPVYPAPTLDDPLFTHYGVLIPVLEALGFPATDFTPITTPRTIIRHLQRCLNLGQRLYHAGRLFPDGLTLDSRVADLRRAQRLLLGRIIREAGGTPSVLRRTQTLRTAITLLANQLPYPARLLDVVL